MQDGAPGHSAASMQLDIQERDVRVLHWPASSPDLDLIETVWNWMMDYIQAHCSEKLSYDKLREAVEKAWSELPEDFLNNFYRENEGAMPGRDCGRGKVHEL